MGKFKKIMAGAVVTALVVGVAGVGLNKIRQGNQKQVMVTSVSGLASDYYMPSSTLDGTITTNVSQNITVDNDMIIQQVYVDKGDRVKKGDLLISFDMTLVEMELNIAKLKHQKLEQDLNKAQKRLSSLQNGGPVTEDDVYNSGTADNISEDTDTSPDLDSNDDMASISALSTQDMYLAAILHPIMLAALTENDGFQDAAETEDPDSESNMDAEMGSGQDAIQYYNNGASGKIGQNTTGSDGFTSDGYPEIPEPAPTATPDPNYEVFHEDDNNNFGFTDGEEVFALVLDENTEPAQGIGSKEDPFLFYVSSAKGEVKATGAFLNKMAGYNEDGTRIVKEGGYWYLLEFHENDTVLDYTDRKASCTGYYLINGSMLTKPVDRFASMNFTLDGASQYEEEPEEPGEDDYGDGGGGNVTGLTRAEAIKIQQNRITSLKLDIQESDINIAKLEKKVNRQTVYSRIDGIVATVGDPLTGTNSDSGAFLSVKSDDGFFVKGNVGELQLDKMTEGTMLRCTSYSFETGESNDFEAEVIDVSEYPSSGDSSYYYWGEGNPNVSNYGFTAIIPDKSVSVQDGDSVTVMMAEEAVSDGIVLSKAFVKSENGRSYVYKDENGVLKKQAVTVGGNVDGGYSVLIKGGISRDDLIAFPYAKAVREGVGTREVTVDQFYGY